MIDLFFWTTPNGYQATILLKELGWDGSTTPETRARRASGLAALKDTLGRNCEKPSGAAWDVLFGKGQFERHWRDVDAAATRAETEQR